MNRYVRLDTLETVTTTPEAMLWGTPCREVLVKRFHLYRLPSPGQVPFLQVSAQWAVRLVEALPLAGRAARIAYLLARDGDGCLYCGRTVDPRTCTVEHVVAQGDGGPDHAANLALTCPECNAAAGHLPAAGKLRLALKLRGVALAAALLLFLAVPSAAQTLFGVVTRVSDGDTLTVGVTRIRLYGIDAPEGKQECRNAQGLAYRCGDRAEALLAALAPVGASVSCRVMDVDRYGRLVAVCSVALRAGSDLGREMVLAGWAVAYRRYSTRYVAEEERARLACAGLWAGVFQAPEDWRKAVRK